MVGLLEGVHGDLGPGGQEWHTAIQSSVHRQVVVVVQAAASLDNGQPLVAWIEHHLSVAAELGTWVRKAGKSTICNYTLTVHSLFKRHQIKKSYAREPSEKMGLIIIIKQNTGIDQVKKVLIL